MELAVMLAVFLAGIILIVKGGDFFVDAASWIAEISGIPKLVVGATIVSLATTLPELLVSMLAAVQGKVDMAVGNAVGSVTANLGLIMAISVVCMPGVIRRGDYLLKALLMLSACAAPAGENAPVPPLQEIPAPPEPPAPPPADGAEEPPKRKRGRPKKPEVPKVKYAEFVTMTEEEYEKLVAELGEEKAKRAIEILDNYKGQSGKTYKSDYRAILNWTIERVNEEFEKRGGGSHGGTYADRGHSGQPAGPGDFKPSGGFKG